MKIRLIEVVQFCFLFLMMGFVLGLATWSYLIG
jgi:hypothetical protein